MGIYFHGRSKHGDSRIFQACSENLIGVLERTCSGRVSAQALACGTHITYAPRGKGRIPQCSVRKDPLSSTAEITDAYS